MSTGQIIIIVTMTLLWIISYFKVGYNLKDYKSLNLLWFAVFTFLSAFCFTMFVILMSEKNKLQEKAKQKCPELEEVRGVYKIKK